MTDNEFPAQLSVLLPGFGFTTSSGHAALCGVYLIESSSDGVTSRMIVDPGHVGRRPVLLEALQSRGLTPGDIDLVALTHSHWDHAQNADMFPSATVILHPLEREYSECPHENDWATPPWTSSIYSGMTVREMSEGDIPLPGVGIVDMPGHSPGSIAFTISTPTGPAVLTGDALHFASVAQTRSNPLIFWDADQARESIERVIDMADVIYPGHDDPFRLTADGQLDFTTRHELTMVGLTPDTPGLGFVGGSPITSQWIMPGIESQRPAMEARRSRHGA